MKPIRPISGAIGAARAAATPSVSGKVTVAAESVLKPAGPPANRRSVPPYEDSIQPAAMPSPTAALGAYKHVGMGKAVPDYAAIVEAWRAETWASMPERHQYAPDAHIADCLPRLVEALRGNS